MRESECVSNALGGRTLNLKRRGVRARELIEVFEFMEFTCNELQRSLIN